MRPDWRRASGTPCTSASCSSRRRARARSACAWPRCGSMGSGWCCAPGVVCAGRRSASARSSPSEAGSSTLPAADAWQRARGVHAQLRADALADTGARRGGLAGVVDGVRARAQAVLRTGVPPPEGALLRGMALGDDAALPDRTRDEFRASGLSHLVAASGQNVMLLAALVLGGRVGARARAAHAARARAGRHRALRAARRRRAVDPARRGDGRRGGGRGPGRASRPLAGTRCCWRRRSRWRSIRARCRTSAGSSASRQWSPSSCWPGAPATAWSGAACRAASPRRRLSPARRRWGPRRSSRRTSARPRSSRCRPTCWPRPPWRRPCGWPCSPSRWASSARRWPRPSWPSPPSPSRTCMWVAHVASGVPGARASAPAGLVGRRVRGGGAGGHGAPRAGAGRGGAFVAAMALVVVAVARAQLRARGMARAHAVPADSPRWPRARRAPGSRRPPGCGSPSSTSARATPR